MTSLTLRLVEIPEAGLVISEEAPLGWLRDVMRLTDEDAVQPVSPLVINLRVTKLKARITVTGEARTKLAFVCSRCGKASEQALRVALKETFLPAEKFVLPAGKNVDLDPADFKFAYYERDELDLGAYLGESVLLELPMFPVCPDPESCSPDEVVWREDWDRETEETRDVNPAWHAQLSLVREEFVEAAARARTGRPNARGKGRTTAKKRTQ